MKKIFLKVLVFIVVLSFDNVFASSYEKYDVGDKIKYDPVADEVCENGDTCYTWYAIKESGYTDKNLSMILDHNIGEQTAIVSDATNAFQQQLEPDAARSYLQTLTSNWKYTGRLITKQEVLDILGISSFVGHASIENHLWLSSTDYYWVDAIHDGYCWTISDTVFENAYIVYRGILQKYYVRPVVDIEKKPVTNKTINSTNESISISSAPIVIDKLSKVDITEFSKDSEEYKKLLNIFKDKKNVIAYNFNLYDSNNKIVEPESKVTVNIKLPKNINYDKLKVWYISDNFNKQELSYSIKEDILSFETDHFSIYALTEDIEGEVVQVADTAFSITKLGVSIGLVILVLGVMVIVQTLLKDKQKNQ